MALGYKQVTFFLCGAAWDERPYLRNRFRLIFHKRKELKQTSFLLKKLLTLRLA
jgi:hypothetical protein